MRIRIRHTPAISHISVTLLQRFEAGLQYEVEDSLGALFLDEGSAELVASKEPALVIPLRTLFLTTEDEAIAADIVFDDAVAAAILRLSRQHE